MHEENIHINRTLRANLKILHKLDIIQKFV